MMAQWVHWADFFSKPMFNKKENHIDLLIAKFLIQAKHLFISQRLSD